MMNWLVGCIWFKATLIAKVILWRTLLHYGSLPFTSVVGSGSRPSSHVVFVTTRDDGLLSDRN